MVFSKLLAQMESENTEITLPISFQNYAASVGSKAQTAPSISIDSYSKLPKELKASNTMALRLGSRKGCKQTRFSLIKTNNVKQFFFDDNALFSSLTPELYLPNVSIRSLFAFQLLPKVTETSVVNLALASGLLAEALNFEKDQNIIVPATGQSIFTFKFKPLLHNETVLEHIDGQVEIDAIFVAKRNGKEHLFVVEAKHGDKLDTLAKHKLLYPVLSVLQKLPPSMPIVPVYLRSVKKENGIDFYIAECPAIVNRDDELYCLEQLNPSKVHALHLSNY
ncbi:DUF6997 domain-containing protein [Pseudoalteromonas sp. SSM20]|uniref:DUF6997 domain-containing protein n=1 Tax=Pseudoalteromonas sp. SSM20 TaxID=3139394 RepID=UPI003BAC362F